jgi:hypothetical protein
MKKYLNMKFILVAFLGLLSLTISSELLAQEQQYKARLSVDYHKIMGDRAYLLINGKFKGEDGYEPTVELTVNVYKQIVEDSLLLIGTAITDSNGNAEFDFISSATESADSIIKHTLIVKIEDSQKFEDGNKKVSYQDVELSAETIVKDSVDHITAKLIDTMGNPLEGEKLVVMVHRLFAPLTIGESSYRTDDDGTILVPIEESLPGIDGILTFEVMIDSRKYGLVRKIFEAPIGVPVVDLSTFGMRTMWSPPGKTPWFLWVFANLGIVGIWGTIMLLMRNLYKIYKS